MESQRDHLNVRGWIRDLARLCVHASGFWLKGSHWVISSKAEAKARVQRFSRVAAGCDRRGAAPSSPPRMFRSSPFREGAIKLEECCLTERNFIKDKTSKMNPKHPMIRRCNSAERQNIIYHTQHYQNLNRTLPLIAQMNISQSRFTQVFPPPSYSVTPDNP